MRKLGYKQIDLFSIIILVLLVSFNINYNKTDFSFSHNDKNSPRISSTHYFNETLKYSRNFSMLEFSDEIGTKENISSINFDLGSSRWNITSLELNFTDIKLDRETITVEENGDNVKTVSNKDDEEGWGVQINITETTIIFGVYIHAFMELKDEIPPTEPVYLQIRGFEAGTENKPNSTIYRNISINIDTESRWYFQNFTRPLKLSVGQYYLVINGTGLVKDETKYRWWFYDHPANPNLHISRFKDGEWEQGDVNRAFDYKLVQRVNRSYYPETINMTAKIDGISENITNGIKLGSGNLTLPNINFSIDSKNLYIPISHNQSFDIFFNLSYKIELRNSFLINGTVATGESSINEWYLTHIIDKCINNYSLRFDYPISWSNFKVNASQQNITDSVYQDQLNYFLFIPNASIIDGAKLEIFAQSPNVKITITAKTEFKIDEFLNFTIYPPNSEGSNNITYVLNDEEGYEINYETEINPVGPINFSFQIALYPYPGYWKALIFWNNETDAGFQSQSFLITTLTTSIVIESRDNKEGSVNEVLFLDQLGVTIFALIAGSIIATSLTLYVRQKRIRIIHLNKKQKVLSYYNDTLNLQSIIISNKNSGLNMYDLSFTKKNIDNTLLSGFLEAIRQFGIELLTPGEESPIIKIEFHKSKLLLMEFETFRIIFIMNEVPSQEFLSSIRKLSSKIEEIYGKFLMKFNGDLSVFSGLKEFINHYLNIIFLYPLKVNLGATDVKMTTSEKTLYYRAIKYITKNGLDCFFAKNLLPPNECDYKDIDVFHRLVEKNLFFTEELVDMMDAR